MRPLLALVLMMGLGACSTGQESPNADPAPRPRPSATPPGSSPEPAVPTQPDASATPACAEVRAGIVAFNAGAYRGTVAHFRLALPLARAQARTAPSGAADDLVEAVAYYAGLAPADYPESARSSAAFAKYKAITLGQCQPVGMPSQDGETTPPGVTT